MKMKSKSGVVVATCVLFFICLLCGFEKMFEQKTVSAAASDENIICRTTIEENFEDNKVLVTLKPEYSKFNKISSYIEEQITKFGGKQIENLTEFPVSYVRSDGTLNPKTAPSLAEYYKKTPFKQILSIILDKSDKQNVLDVIKKIETLEEVLVAYPNMIDEVKHVPNDALYSHQWALNNTQGIHAQDAWNVIKGSNVVRVGVIDSGIANHSDLNANVVQGKDCHNNNLITNDDEDGHGTSVAGIIGAISNSIGVSGIAPKTKLVPLQTSFWDENEKRWLHTSEARAKAIQYAIDTWENQSTRISVLNHSIGGYGTNTYLLSYISNYPGLFVWSAGNDGKNVDNFTNISRFNLDNLISVGAINKNSERSVWNSNASSNYGMNVDIYAPGGEGQSSDYSYNIVTTSKTNNGYRAFNGTSAAAPHVAGVAALLLSENPQMTGAELKSAILAGADEFYLYFPDVDSSQRVKKLNAFGALGKLSRSQLFAGGSGYLDDPYLISNEQQFRNMGLAYRSVYIPRQGYEYQINYAFKLTRSITISEDWAPFTYRFAGDFDGGGHYISYNMHLTQEDLNDSVYQGLFGFVVNGGHIHDLELMNCSITSDTNTTLSKSDYYIKIGIVTATSYEAKGLKNVTVTNPKIECKISKACIGALSGSFNEGYADNCVVRQLNGSASITNNTHGYLGGMAGLGDIFRFEGCSVTIALKNTSFNGNNDKMGEVVGNSDKSPSDYNIVANVTMDKGSCLVSSSLITLSDGTQKPVESLTGTEMLLVWNLYTGQYDAAPILFIDRDSSQKYSVIKLSFSNGKTVKIVSEHGFWDYNLNQYVYLDKDATQYIGHWFSSQSIDKNGNAVNDRVQLLDVTIQTEIVEVYSPVTYGHLCYYVNGMLSMPGGIDGLFNIFEVDAESMKYDISAMVSDIAQYGLFTFEEFSQILPVSQEVFDAFNAQYFKIAIGKGLVTEERLAELVDRYAGQLGIE